MALGAARPRVLAGVLRDDVLQAGAGLMAATLPSSAAAGFVRSQLFGLAPTDPTTFAAAAVVLLVVAALACVVPARRAATVDDAAALREE